jgi:hypothetical protein
MNKDLDFIENDEDNIIELQKYQCPNCMKILSSMTNYKYHVNSKKCTRKKGFECSFCNKFFTRSHNYKYHIKNNVCGLVSEEINQEIKKNNNEEINEINNNLMDATDYQLKIDEKVYKQIAAEEIRNYIRDRIAKENDNKSIKEIKKLTPFKKQKISNIFKRQCWNYWIGEHIGKIICPCCKLTEISQLNFSCGHIIPESKGGKLIVENVRPICSNCNSSVYVDNLTDYI